MKQYLSLVVAVMIVSSTAFASRARLEALGEGKNGSYYIQDGRNIFLNPAQIVKNKKKLWLEVGANQTNGTTATADSATWAGSRPQGGFSNTFGDFTYGLFLNNTSDRAVNGVATANAVATTDFIAPDSQVEFFIGGEQFGNWGLSVFHAGNSTRDTGTNLVRNASLLGARVGYNTGDLNVFSSFGISSKSEIKNTTGDNYKGKFTADAGATYAFGDMTVFGRFFTGGADTLIGTTTIKNTNTEYGVGAGWKHEMTKNTTMFTRLQADMGNSNTDNGFGAKKFYNVPVVVAAETAALSWLTVRGSIAQSLLGQLYNTNGSKTDLAGTTTLALGLGLNFGELTIDGTLATDGTAGGNTDVTGFGTGGNTNSTFGFGNGMLSRVGLTYNF